MKHTEKEYKNYTKQFKDDSKRSIKLIQLSLNCVHGLELDKDLTAQIEGKKKAMFSIFSKVRLVPNALCSELDMSYSNKISSKADKFMEARKKNDVDEMNKIAKSILRDLDKYLADREEAKNRDIREYIDYLYDEITDGKYY